MSASKSPREAPLFQLLALFLFALSMVVLLFRSTSVQSSLQQQVDVSLSRPLLVNSVLLQSALSTVPLPLQPTLHVQDTTTQKQRETERWSRGRRMAVCMVGDARDFELSGPTILKRLLKESYPELQKDVFLVSPLSSRSFKFWILKYAQHVAAVRIFSPDWIDTSQYPPDLLFDPGSPHGNQGIFQYFRLVESCVGLVDRHQRSHNFTYEWVMRIRVDSFWAGVAPPLSTMNPHALTAPLGCNFGGGINDRLEMSSWNVALRLLPWVTNLRNVLGEKRMNSHLAIKKQAQAANISVDRVSFPFCIVTRRIYWNDNVMIASLNSTAEMNGAKCQPCTPKFTKDAAKEHYKGYADDGKIGLEPPDGLSLCDTKAGWERDWEALYDAQMGDPWAFMRKSTTGVTYEECMNVMEDLRTSVSHWDAPSPSTVCMQRNIGDPVLIGQSGNSFYTLISALKHRGTVAIAQGPDKFLRDSAAWQLAANESRPEVFWNGNITPASAQGQAFAALVVDSSEVLRFLALGDAPAVCQWLIYFSANRESVFRSEVFAALAHCGYDQGPCIKEGRTAPERCLFFLPSLCAKVVEGTQQNGDSLR